MTRSPEETRTVGAALAQKLRLGSAVSLEGVLGAGKTQFVQGITTGLGCDMPASSPSFALMHEYAGGKLPVFHFDFYRMRDASELLTAGYDDCLFEGITLIEWGDRFPEALPEGVIRVRIQIGREGEREIEIG